MTIKQVSEKYDISQDTLRYYERIGVLPPVTRTAGGIRDYTEKDLSWVSLALCMRSAGLPIEALTKYVKLCEQRGKLVRQRDQINETLDRLNHKIELYGEAVDNGVKQSWM